MSKKIKVGFLALHKYKGIGGIEVVLNDIVTSFKKDMEVFVYFVQEPDDYNFVLKFESYRCFRVPRLLRKKHFLRPKFSYKLFLRNTRKKLFKKMAEDDLDYLLILDLSKHLRRNIDYLLDIKNNNRDLKVISWTHTKLPHLNNKDIQAMNIFDAFFAISSGIRNRIKQLGFDNVHTIYNPIKDADLVARARNHFLYIGRIDENKRVVELLNIFSEIKEKNYIFEIYGSTGSEEGDKRFSQIIEGIDFKGQVKFHGWKNDPWSYISEASVLLLNSRQEGFGLVLAEAMMRGIPCLSSDCEAGPADIIEHGHNGWLFAVDDQQELKNMIQKIILGEVVLPDPLVVKESVSKFSHDLVVSNFKSKLLSL